MNTTMGTATFVHLYGRPSIRVDLCSDGKCACVCLSASMHELYLFGDADQLDALAAAASRAADMLRDQGRTYPGDEANHDGGCEPGPEPDECVRLN